jgi:hypothetical protein
MTDFGVVLSQLRKQEQIAISRLASIRSAISALDGHVDGRGGNRSGSGRRGRRMSAANRKAVSERMKKYWAARRKSKS